MGHEIGTNRLPGGDAAGLKGLESALRLRPQHGLAAGPGDGDLAAATDIRRGGGDFGEKKGEAATREGKGRGFCFPICNG